MTTNFITPPDFVDDPNYTILIVDADPADVETLAYLCAGHDEAFNVYLYRADMDNDLWLNQAADRADTIIVNTIDNKLSSIKDHFIDFPKTYHYGPKHFLHSARRCSTLLEYFVIRANDRKHQTTGPL
mgnify:FL=1